MLHAVAAVGWQRTSATSPATTLRKKAFEIDQGSYRLRYGTTTQNLGEQRRRFLLHRCHGDAHAQLYAHAVILKVSFQCNRLDAKPYFVSQISALVIE